MATDYALNLRATLDTTLVKQQLQQLRSALSSSYSVGDQVGNSQMGLSHMQKIEVQLTRLGQSISSLQRAIEQLARAETRAASSGNSHPAANGQGSLPVAAQHAYSNAAEKAWLNSALYKRISLRVSRVVASDSFSDMERRLLEYRFGKIDSQTFAHNMLLQNGLLGRFDKEWYKQQVNSYGNSTVEGRLAAKELQAAMRQNRKMAAMIGGLLFGGAADIARNLGYTDTANILGATGSGLTAGGGAAMTASMMGAGSAAGPIGLLVGLATVFSTLYSSASDAAAAIQKMSEQMNEAFKTLHQNTLGIQRSVQETRHLTNADMLESTGNIDEARKLAKYWKENTLFILKSFADADPLAEERRIRERGEARKRNVDKAMQEGDVSWLDNDLASFVFHLTGNLDVNDNAQKAKNEVDRQTAEQIADLQRKYASMQQEMTSAQKIQAMYQGVVDKLEGQQKSEFAKSAAEVAARLRLNDANDAAIFGYKSRQQLNLTQSFVNGIIDNKNIGALDKFNTIAAELDSARSLKNAALTNAFEISKYLKQNEGTIDSTEMQAKQKRQAQYEKEASTIDLRIGILESALTEILTSTVAPDLSHVTSLAQYGFNMGEKDNGVERMEKYYTKSINLQQQIKDKLQEGVKTEAVYN